jgi:hypothetical protein
MKEVRCAEYRNLVRDLAVELEATWTAIDRRFA